MSKSLDSSVLPTQSGHQAIFSTPIAVVGIAICNSSLPTDVPVSGHSSRMVDLGEFWHDLLRGQASFGGDRSPPTSGSPHATVSPTVLTTSLRDTPLHQVVSPEVLRFIQAALQDAGYREQWPSDSENLNVEPDSNVDGTLTLTLEVGHLTSSQHLGERVESPSVLAHIVQTISSLEQGQYNIGMVGATVGVGPELAGVILVLKRLEIAEQDHNQIYGVIRGGGIVDAKEGVTRSLQPIHTASQIDAQTLSLLQIQSYGLTSIQSLDTLMAPNLFPPRSNGFPTCAIDLPQTTTEAAKENAVATDCLGDCLGSMVALIKIILGLHQNILPPTTYPFDLEELGTSELPFYSNTQMRPWIRQRGDLPNRAGISAWHDLDTMTHLVLEEYIPQGRVPLQSQPVLWSSQGNRQGVASAVQKQFNPRLDVHWPTELLVFAATSQTALIQLIRCVQELCAQSSAVSLAAIATTLATQSSGTHRLAVVAASLTDLAKKLAQALKKLEGGSTSFRLRSGLYYRAEMEPSHHQVACLFPGQGAQYPNMLLDLALYFPRLQAWFNDLNTLFTDEDSILPSTFVFPPPTGLSDEGQQQAQQLLYSVVGGAQATLISNLALFELLQTFNVPCDVMLGHSNGENSALMASGFWQFQHRLELLQLIRETIRLTPQRDQAIPIPTGVNLTVNGFDQSTLEAILDEFSGHVHWAMDNCPQQIVLFGEAAVMKTVAARFTETGSICTTLPFDRGYHTPLYQVRLPALKQQYQQFTFAPGHTPLFSCATTEPFPDDPEAIREKAIYQWTHRVQFRQTIEALYAQGVDTFVEVGPGNLLTSFVNDILRQHKHMAIPINLKQRPGLAQLQHLLAQLYVQGVAVDFSPLFADRPIAPVHLVALAPLATPHSASRSVKTTLPEIDSPQTERAEMGNLGSTVLPLRPSSAAPFPQSLSTQEPNTPEPSTPEPSTQEPLTQKSMIPEPNIQDSITQEPVIQESATQKPISSTQPHHVSDDHSGPSGAETGEHVRLALLQGHFDLMQTFLDTQARSVTALLAHLRQSHGNLSEPSVVPRDSSASHWQRWPLLGPILKQDGQQLYCERRFDLERDRFLREHTLGSHQHLNHQGLCPLAVVPFSISMEIVAQAASCLLGGTQVVTGLSHLRSSRWLALDREFLDLGILAQLQPKNAVNPTASGLAQSPAESAEDLAAATQVVMVQLFELDAADPQSRRLVFTGQAHLRDQFPPPGAPQPSPFSQPLPAARRAQLPVQTFYDRYLFHGPCFRSIAQVHQWNDHQITATFQVPSSETFFRDLDAPSFQVPGPWLDSVGQLVAFWFTERQHQDFGLFPFGLQSFEQFQPPSPVGSRLNVASSITQMNDGIYMADFQVWDEYHRPIVRIEGWHMRYYPSRLIPWILRPRGRDSCLSEHWSSEDIAAEGLFCRRLNGASLDVLEENWGIWKRALAHQFLTRRERSHWYGLGETNPQGTEWLLGRIVAKETVCQWVRQYYRVSPAAVDLELWPMTGEQFSVSWVSPHTLPARLPQVLPALSLSHSAGGAIATLNPNSFLATTGENRSS
ncbi:MAG: polyketide synthase dehydratase domain-containing protein [Leptolyngbyaceae cyanobacterium]